MVEIKEIFSEAAKFLLKEKNAKQNNIALALNMSVSSVNDYVNGRREGDEMTRTKIAKNLGHDYRDFMSLGRHIIETGSADGWVKQPKLGAVDCRVLRDSSSEKYPNGVATGTSVPVISWVQAGAWTEISDPFQPGEADDFILVCKNVSKGTFALRIKGDSMVPEFLPGEIIIIDPSVQPETGKFVIAKTENGNGDNEEATFKQFIRDGNEIFLKALNPIYGIKNMTGKKFRIVGCVVQKTKEY